MQRLLILLMLLLGACGPLAPVGAPPPPEAARAVPEATASFRRAVPRIEPVSERLCRQRNPDFPPAACDFRFVLTNDPRLGQNAFQTIGADGRPVVTFTLALLQVLENEDEVAFILAHETGHQIARHLLRQQGQSRLGAAILGTLVASTGQATIAEVESAAELGAFLGARAYSKNFELEADRIATVIATRAGYDPIRGAAPFARFETGSNAFLSTHPPSAERLAVVADTAARLGLR